MEKYNTIWNKVSTNIKKEFDSKPFSFFFFENQNKGDKATDFHNKEIPKVGSNHTCLAAISSDSASTKDEKYYPLKKKVIRYITDDTESSSDEA